MKSSFYKNVIKLSATSALAQLFPFLLLPVLQKWYYSPSDFGQFGLFVSVSSVFISISTLKLEFAIVGATNKADALNLTLATFSVAICLSLLLPFIFGVYLYFDSTFLNINNPAVFLFWLAMGVLAFTGYQTLHYWYNFEKNYSLIGNSKVFQSSTTELIKLVSGIKNISTIGLIGGRVIGQLLALLLLLYLFLHKNVAELKKVVSIDSIKQLVKANKNFVYFSAPSSLIGTLSNNFHIIIMAGLYESATVGFISTAFFYTAIPLGLISNSFSQVFYKEITEISSKNQMLTIFKKNVSKLLIPGIILGIFTLFIPKRIIEFTIGIEWIESLQYMKIMIFYIIVSFVSSSLSFTFIRLNKQKELLLLDIFHFVIVFISIWLAHVLYADPIITVLFFSIAQIVYYTLVLTTAFQLIKSSKLLIQ